jgi:hypothetical protein
MATGNQRANGRFQYRPREKNLPFRIPVHKRFPQGIEILNKKNRVTKFCAAKSACVSDDFTEKNVRVPITTKIVAGGNHKIHSG